MADYSGPSTANNFLHSIPHCSFSAGCHSLPFEHDTASMFERHDGGHAYQWMEAVGLIGGVPFVAFLLYLFIDSIVRCARHCCCKSREAELDDSFLPPSSRVALSGGFGAAPAFPAAEVSSPLPAHSHLARRGGVAGQMGDYSRGGPSFGAAHNADPTNPFHTSSRLISVAHAPSGDDDYLAEAEVARPVDQDKSYDTRMLIALIFSVAAITLLATSIVFSERFDSRWEEVRADITQTRSFFDVQVQQQGIGLLQTDTSNTYTTLATLYNTGKATPTPLSTDRLNEIINLMVVYDNVASRLVSFADQVSSQSSRLGDAVDMMDHVEMVREDATYVCVAVAMFWAIFTLAIYTYYRRRPLLAFFSSTFFAFVILGLCGVWAVSLAAGVGVSDICQAPIAYGNSIISSSWVNFSPRDVAIATYYVDCDGLTTNPLQTDLDTVKTILDASSGSGAGTLGDLVTYINSERSDLVSFARTLTSLNATTHQDVAPLADKLECDLLHAYVMHAVDHACHPIMDALWTTTCLQFFACLCLLLVRGLVLMRTKRADVHDDDLFSGADSPRARVNAGASPHAHPAFSAPDNGVSAMYGTGSANFAPPERRYSAM